MPPSIRSRAGQSARIAALAVTLAAALCANAHAQQASATSDTFAAATERFEAGDYRAALELFETARAAGADEPAVHYNIGVAEYRLALYERSAATFRMLGERFPELGAIADYNLGLAEHAAGDTAEARRAFSRAAASADPTIAELATQMLERTADEGTPPARTPAWTRYVELQTGHDDNVALLEEASLPAGQSSSSPFVEVLAVASGEPFRRAAVTLDFSGYVVRYPDAPGFDQEALRFGARYRASAGSWRIEAGPHYDRSTLDGAGFEQQLGASVSLRRALGPGIEAEIRVQHDRVEELEPEFEYVRGSRQRMRIGVARELSSGRVGARYELERNDRLGPAVSADRDRFALDYERYLARDWSVELGIAYRTSRFELRPREEDLVELRIAALKLFGAGWLVRAEAYWADNDATVAPLVYQRTRLGLGLARIF